MFWKASRLDLVANKRSFLHNRSRIRKRSSTYRFQRLKIWSIINLSILASVLAVNMVEGLSSPFRPSTSPIMTTTSNNDSNGVSTDLFALCSRSSMTSLNFTTISRFLTQRVPTCSLFSWKNLFPFVETDDANKTKAWTVNCTQILGIKDTLLRVDEEIQKFKSILKRYECRNEYKYSSKTNCWNCIVSYKNWLCLTQLKSYHDGSLTKPCLDVCYNVIRSCPSFLPDDDYSHGGYSAFDCPKRDYLTDYSSEYGCVNT